MQQLPFPEYKGKTQIADYTLPEDLQAFDALSIRPESTLIRIIPAHETVRLVTVSSYGAIIHKGIIVGRY